MTFFPASCAFALPTETMITKPINACSALYDMGTAPVKSHSKCWPPMTTIRMILTSPADGAQGELDRLTTGLQRLPDPGQQLRSGDCCERDYECCDEVVDHDGRVARLSERTVGHTSKTRHQ